MRRSWISARAHHSVEAANARSSGADRGNVSVKRTVDRWGEVREQRPAQFRLASLGEDRRTSIKGRCA
jgi:hypothetical protein